MAGFSFNGIVRTIQPGTNVTVNNTDPTKPVVNATGGGGGSFNGARLGLSVDSAAMSFPTGVTASFDTAVLNIGGGWYSAGAPTRITIPAGVAYAEISATTHITTDGNPLPMQITIRKNGADFVMSYNLNSGSSAFAKEVGTLVSTGPIAVTAGDYFEVFINASTVAANTILKATQTYFAAKALG